MHRAPTQRVSLCRCAREVRRVRALRYARALARPRSKPPLRTYAPTSPTPCTLPPARGVRPSCKAARAAWRVFEQPISTPPRDRSRPQHAPHRPPQARGRCAGAAAGGGGRESAGDGAATARGRRRRRVQRQGPAGHLQRLRGERAWVGGGTPASVAGLCPFAPLPPVQAHRSHTHAPPSSPGALPPFCRAKCCCYNGGAGIISYEPSDTCTCSRKIHTGQIVTATLLSVVLAVAVLLSNLYLAGSLPISPYPGSPRRRGAPSSSPSSSPLRRA